MLELHGMRKVCCKGISFKGQSFSLDNSLSNDDWLHAFNELTEKVQGFLNTSCDVSERLVAGLEHLQAASEAEHSKALAGEHRLSLAP